MAEFTESILDSVKEDIGAMVAPDDEAPFDNSLIRYINTALGFLFQLGVGSEPFKITGSTETWSDFLGEDSDLDAVKSYVTKEVKLMFDPPSSSYLLDADRKVISELEWRINLMADEV